MSPMCRIGGPQPQLLTRIPGSSEKTPRPSGSPAPLNRRAGARHCPSRAWRMRPSAAKVGDHCATCSAWHTGELFIFRFDAVIFCTTI